MMLGVGSGDLQLAPAVASAPLASCRADGPVLERQERGHLRAEELAVEFETDETDDDASDAVGSTSAAARGLAVIAARASASFEHEGATTQCSGSTGLGRGPPHQA